MNDAPQPYRGADLPPEDLEGRLRLAAQALAYPPTPDVSRRVGRRLMPRRPFWSRRGLVTAGILLALLLGILIAVPPVRAAILDWIRIGAVRIFFGEPTQTPLPTLLPGQTASPEPTELPSPTPLRSILDISGQTTLAQAASDAGFPIRLPAYPSDLGLPDRVYFQNLNGPVVFLVWFEPSQPGKVRLSLTETQSNNFIFQKIVPKSVENTSVNAQPAIWVDAPYLLISRSGDFSTARLIDTGHTLVWTEGSLTFRLETGSDLAEAILTAESVRVEP